MKMSDNEEIGLPPATRWLERVRAGCVVLSISTAGHLVWEIGQLPLFTIWNEGTRSELAFAVAHCTAGDVLITTAALGSAIILGRAWSWPHGHWTRVIVIAIIIGVCYTAFSEWLNVYVRDSWSYGPAMPILQFGTIGIGLSPLLQWLVIPLLALTLTKSVVLRAIKQTDHAQGKSICEGRQK